MQFPTQLHSTRLFETRPGLVCGAGVRSSGRVQGDGERGGRAARTPVSSPDKTRRGLRLAGAGSREAVVFGSEGSCGGGVLVDAHDGAFARSAMMGARGLRGRMEVGRMWDEDGLHFTPEPDRAGVSRR
eukprot:1464802-Rhodomonas_salina.2